MLSVVALLAILALALVASARSEHTVRVRCDTTAGPWTVEVHPSWSPNGAKRYLELVGDGFFTNLPLFRAVPGFLVQFGISMDRDMNKKWEETIADDPFPIGQVDMKKGIMAYAGYGKHSRSTQIWIGYEGAAGLGKSPWETPFAEIIEGLENVVAIYGGYGDKPDQGKLHSEGESYARESFPKMDWIKKCVIGKSVEQVQGGGSVKDLEM